MCETRVPAKKYSLSADVYAPYFLSYCADSSRQLYLAKKHYVAVNQSQYCRTASMGEVVFKCESCGEGHTMNRSCKHRFCARCGIVETYRWGEVLRGRLLSLSHCHITFTLPKDLRFLARCSPTEVYGAMFRSISALLQEWFLHKHGLKCGVVMVLHTSGSDLKYHPHIHCIVSCGGVKTDSETGEQRLVALNDAYLCNHEFLGKQFKAKLSSNLRDLCVHERLANGDGEVLSMSELEHELSRVSGKKWIVGIEKGLSKVEQIVGYIGRYTKRACISEYKIVSIQDGRIKFKFNDYANTPRGAKPVVGLKEMSITGFLDALLQHVPDKGFQAVRYCGLYANASHKKLPASFFRAEPIEMAELEAELLKGDVEVEQYEQYRQNQRKLYGKDPFVCSCGTVMAFSHLRMEGKRFYGKVKTDSS